MSPSVSKMQNENFMCVVAPTEHGLVLFHRLGWKSRSKKGFAFKVLCYNQRMDKGQLDCDISNSWCFIKTDETILNTKLIFKLDSISTQLKTNKYNFNLETMKLFSFEPTFHFIHIVNATSAVHAYPVIVQCHLTYGRLKSTPTKTYDYIISAAYICHFLKMTLKDSCIWHPIKKIKQPAREVQNYCHLLCGNQLYLCR